MSMKNFVEANAFAFQAHKGQLRKGVLKLPYITHPLTVTNILAKNGFAADYGVLAAAMLHDVVEDCGVTLEEIIILFGPRIALLVQEVTFAPGTSKADKVRRAASMSPDGRSIKVADLISNINSIAEDPTAMSPEAAFRFVNYAQDFKRAAGHVSAALTVAFDNAILNFNLNYLPQEI